MIFRWFFYPNFKCLSVCITYCDWTQNYLIRVEERNFTFCKIINFNSECRHCWYFKKLNYRAVLKNINSSVRRSLWDFGLKIEIADLLEMFWFQSPGLGVTDNLCTTFQTFTKNNSFYLIYYYSMTESKRKIYSSDEISLHNSIFKFTTKLPTDL